MDEQKLSKVELYTIGFTKTSAENFFNRLKSAGVKKIIDIRLNNNSQLSGFAKKNDLEYFLRKIAEMEYEPLPLLAPTKDILDDYKKKKGAWEIYEQKFLKLMKERGIENKINPVDFHQACLLCSEDKPHYCHRRLIAEYLNEKWYIDMKIKHL